MFEELNQKLEESHQGMSRYQRLGSKLSDYRKQLEELEAKKSLLKDQLAKEETDYENLSKKRLSNLFLELTNKKEEKEQKEYQEVLAAKLKLEEAVKQADALLHTIHNLEEERAALAGCERTFHDLYEKKYLLIKESSPQNAEKISALENNIHSQKNNLTEIEEAINAGSLVLAKIKEAEDSLDRAHNWGTWDLLGGGLISDAMKHSNLDDAGYAIDEVQSLLHHFHSELSDIQLDESLHVQIDGFTRFADFFFDGLLADWMVQSKINSSIESVSALHAKVDRVLDKLRELKRASESSLQQASAELNTFIENL